MYTHEECYKILLIDSECSWNSLRKAYKKLIQKWHPDRFSDELKKRSAEDKIKELNTAFVQLSNYYKKNGSLPSISQSSLVARPRSINKKKRKAPPKKNVSQTSNIHTSNDSPTVSTNKIYLTLVIFISLIIFNFSIEDPDTTNSEQEDQDYVNAEAQKTAADQDKINMQETIKTLDETETSDSKVNATLPTPYYFTYGSTIGDVISIQGPPDHIDGDVWFYGESYIEFKDGTVKGWKRTVKHPLKAHINL